MSIMSLFDLKCGACLFFCVHNQLFVLVVLMFCDNQDSVHHGECKGGGPDK